MWLLRREIDHFIPVSKFLADELHANLQIERDRLTPVHHGVDARFRPADDHRVFDTPFLLTTTPRPELVRAFAGIADTYPTLRLVIVGERGYGTDAAERAAQLHGIADRLDFVGHVGDQRLIDLYRAACVYAHWTGYEGFGLPLLEAMACGTPVVANDVGAVAEVAGDAAVVEDVPAMIAVLERLLGESDWYRELAAAARTRAERFCWPRAAAETVGVYREVVA